MLALASPGRSWPSLTPRPGSPAVGRRIIAILAPFRPFRSVSGSPESPAGACDSGEPPSALRAGLRSGNGRSAFAPAIARCGLCSRAPSGKKESFFASCRMPAAGPSGRDSPRSAHTRWTASNPLPHGAPASLVLAPAGARAGLASSEALSVPSVRRICALGPRCPFRLCSACRARPGPAHFGSSADPPALPAITRPSPRLWPHRLAQTRQLQCSWYTAKDRPCIVLGLRLCAYSRRRNLFGDELFKE